MKISELARTAHCPVETVRYYEKEGLLPSPERTASNYRDYGPQHAERLRFIRNCRALDMAHDEIRALLAMVDAPRRRCSEVNELLDEHITHVDARIRELTELKRQLRSLRDKCTADNTVAACGIVRGLATMPTEARPARTSHL